MYCSTISPKSLSSYTKQKNWLQFFYCCYWAILLVIGQIEKTCCSICDFDIMHRKKFLSLSNTFLVLNGPYLDIALFFILVEPLQVGSITMI